MISLVVYSIGIIATVRIVGNARGRIIEIENTSAISADNARMEANRTAKTTDA